MAHIGAQMMRKKTVGKHLRTMNKKSDIKIQEAAEELGVGRTTAYRHHRGETLPTLAELEKYLRIYKQMHTPLGDYLLYLVKSSKVEWLSEYTGLVYPMQLEVADMENISVEIEGFHPDAFPGIIQSKLYSESIIPRDEETDRPYPWERIVALRAHQRSILLENGAERLNFCIGEAALHRMVGDHDVMRDQGKHLISLVQDHGAKIRILPFHAGVPAGSSFPHFLYITCKRPLDGTVYFDVPIPDQLASSSGNSAEQVKLAMSWNNGIRKVSYSQDETLEYLKRRFK